MSYKSDSQGNVPRKKILNILLAVIFEKDARSFEQKSGKLTTNYHKIS